MKTKLFFITIFSLSLLTTSCSSDDDNSNNATPNIVELAQTTTDLSSLVAALTRADGNLATVLSGNGPFTVLAPTNTAFANFLSDNGFASLEDVPTDVLSQVLLNHVIMADVTSSDLLSLGAGYTPGSASGPDDLNISIYFDTSNGVTFNNVATVTTADINASNGTIHIIDAVLDLPNIVDLAAANSDFSSLVAALGSADGDLVNVLSADGPFTVLAPNNSAFSTFLDGTALGDVDTAALSQILLNHVIIGSTVTSTALVDAGAGYTNTGATGPGDNALSLYYNTSNGVMFNGISTVTQADIVGTNGIIHAIDTVIDIPTVVTFAVADPTFSTLVQALTSLTPATDFAAILARTETGNSDNLDPTFTVFAPTNDAFSALSVIPAENALTQILLHHVIKEANITASMLNNPGETTAETIEGDNITITLPGTGSNIANITDGSGATDIGIIAVDVQAGNGVIHVINKVMINN
ncbi:fasciclin domain-containing protein [Algibacter sp. L1A34]|uniref:fasciclin domain-containing protein n=1 Tax=Algibacter sp. L1A34 TaxID=2686365 RepID=UPI00131C402F|nr:fasciclin domain-containing protein [Algibacter sp. L1A34]